MHFRNAFGFGMTLACSWLCVVTAIGDAVHAQSQSPASAVATTPAQSLAQDSTKRIDALERDMLLIKHSMEIVRDSAIALGGFATIGLLIFGYLSWRRESTQQENYQREREFYERGQRFERQTYRREREFYERHAVRRAADESKLSSQQIEMGVMALTRLDGMLTSQSNNIVSLGRVLDVIAKASDIKLEREEGHAKFEAMMNDLRTGAERRYLHAREETERLREVKGFQWPTLPEDRRRVAISALSAYRAVDDFVKLEKIDKERARHASLLQRLGVFAYYADYNFEGAIDYLSEAVRLFADQALDDQFKPAQAWARHFLGVLKKNWPLRIEPSGTSLKQAQELLAAAEDYLTIESGQFLTPLTHAEVLSYSPGQEHIADVKLEQIIKRLEELRRDSKADSIQLNLLPRAYLLRGNIAHIGGYRSAAFEHFQKACDVAESNPYSWLSLAEATTTPDEAKVHWAKGLSRLSRPPAVDKPETLTRVLVFSWGILASHSVGSADLLKSYRTAFDDIGSVIERDGKYTPLFFSPVTKRIVDFDELAKQLEDYVSKRT